MHLSATTEIQFQSPTEVELFSSYKYGSDYKNSVTAYLKIWLYRQPGLLKMGSRKYGAYPSSLGRKGKEKRKKHPTSSIAGLNTRRHTSNIICHGTTFTYKLMLKVEGKTRDIYVEDNGKSLHYRVKYMVMSMAQFWNAGISEFLNIRIFIQMLT